MILAVWFVSFSFADEDCDNYRECESKCQNAFNNCTKNITGNPTDSLAACQKTLKSCLESCDPDNMWWESFWCADEDDDNSSVEVNACIPIDVPDCEASKIYDIWDSCGCCLNWIVQKSTTNSWKRDCVQNYYGTMWLDINTECLKNGQCHMNVYRTLWIRKSDDDPEVQTFVQDIILGATEFIGTVITVVLMVSGLFYIISAMNGKTELSWRAKKAMIWSIVWLLFVTLSYSIIRLIQFLATWWS